MTTTLSQSALTFWQWRGHNVHYVAAGLDKPGVPLLLIHGFGASTDHWRKNIAPLAEHRPVYAIDMLGFGRSAKPNLMYSGELWRDQFRDFCQEVVGQPVVAAGNSLGGYAALVLAADHPEWVKGLVLLNGAGPFYDGKKPEGIQKFFNDSALGVLQQSWASWLLFQYFRQKSTIRSVLLKVYKDHSAVTDQLVDDIYRPSCDPGAVEVFGSVFQASPQGRYVDELLNQLRVPLLLLWGQFDPWMTVTRAERFVKAYPAAQLKLLDAGHCPHDERPEVVNQYLLDWTAKFEN
jgi:pimeloyl-ACP methyl ester carboxylesterase